MTFEVPLADPNDPRYTRRGALHVRANEGPTVWAVQDTYTIKASSTQTKGLFGFIEATVPPGGGPEPHAHNDQDETFYLTSGELEFVDGDRVFTAVAGDFVYVPRGIRHRFKNRSRHAAKMIFMWTPGGPEEEFLQLETARPGEQSPPVGPEQMAQLIDMSRRLNVDNLPDLS